MNIFEPKIWRRHGTFPSCFHFASYLVFFLLSGPARSGSRKDFLESPRLFLLPYSSFTITPPFPHCLQYHHVQWVISLPFGFTGLKSIVPGLFQRKPTMKKYPVGSSYQLLQNLSAITLIILPYIAQNSILSILKVDVL